MANTCMQIYIRIVVHPAEGRQYLIQTTHNDELQKYITALSPVRNES
jgi:hypothetical protein